MFNLPTLSGAQRRALYFTLSVAVAVGGIFYTLSSGGSQPSVASTATPSYSPVAVPAPTLPATIVVDIAGKVAHPGILTLPQGSRAADAIKAAGGALKGVALTDINLAEVMTDGEQIVVGAPQVTTSSLKSSKSKSGKKGKITSGTININSATLDQLEELPGVGAVMAAKIVAYRLAHGPFTVITDLSKVSGMGKSKYSNLKNFIRV